MVDEARRGVRREMNIVVLLIRQRCLAGDRTEDADHELRLVRHRRVDALSPHQIEECACCTFLMLSASGLPGPSFFVPVSGSLRISSRTASPLNRGERKSVGIYTTKAGPTPGIACC